ncbi:MAG: SAVED domain-containing protein [Rhodobacteraceae bacterium]|nr:SAVED domain-containing protein [Paracoccaceae bacterium]
MVIALDFSYPIKKQDIRSAFNHLIVRLTLDGMSSDGHWSQVKQNRLAQQFLEEVKQLSAVDVERIHLVMAAPNSTVFTFGRRYDKRNLPEIIVYLFEKGNNPTYPWGDLMPVSGVDQAKIVSG